MFGAVKLPASKFKRLLLPGPPALSIHPSPPDTAASAEEVIFSHVDRTTQAELATDVEYIRELVSSLSDAIPAFHWEKARASAMKLKRNPQKFERNRMPFGVLLYMTSMRPGHTRIEPRSFCRRVHRVKSVILPRNSDVFKLQGRR
jgi:hypothetical protein